MCDLSCDFNASLEVNILSHEAQQNFLSDFGICRILCLFKADRVLVMRGHLSHLEKRKQNILLKSCWYTNSN